MVIDRCSNQVRDITIFLMHETKPYYDTNTVVFPSHALSMHMY